MSTWKKSDSKSPVWLYCLTRGRNHNKEAKCNHCNTIISAVGGTTSAIRNHLKIHNIFLSSTGEPEAIDEDAQVDLDHRAEENARTKAMDTASGSAEKKKKGTLTSYFSSTKPSINEVFSELVSVDGFSFNALAKSRYLRAGLVALNYELPSSQNTIRSKVYAFYEHVKKNVSQEIKTFLASKQVNRICFYIVLS